MHELSLMQDTLALARAQAKKAGAQRIHGITLRIGALAGVAPDALEFAFEVLTRDSIAANARLIVEHVPVSCFCANCGAEFQPPDLIYECPRCHQLSAELRHGREMDLVAVEVS